MQQLKQVEKYDIIEEIGHGGMATVYKARDTRLDRLVALKVMHPHLQGAKEARARFAREALTVAKLHHPGILEIYDYSGEDSDISYISTELLTGPTLKEFAEQRPEIPPEIAACVGIQVARALGVAHAEGVIHRDVKPENVMLHEQRLVKLADFGIAQLVDAQSMTTTGQVLGSPGHMAPEQVEGKECTGQSDLFSLGTVLYLLATGELPYTGRNPHVVLKQIVDGNFRDPLHVRASIGGRLRGIIMRCMELEPSKRYQRAEELDRDLVEFVEEMGIESPKDTLAQYLSNPEAFTASFVEQTVLKLTELGEAAQQRGEVPRALDHYNRALAIDDGNERVLAAVQRLGRRSKAKKVIGTGALGGAVLSLLIVAAANRPGPRPVVDADPPTAPAPPEVEPTPEPPTRVETTRPDVDPANAGTKKPRKPVGRGPRMVMLKPFPANVSIGVDGNKPRAFGPTFNRLQLSPGVHRFRFVGAHDCCVDEEVTRKVPPGNGPFTISHRLKFRPAGLYVVSNRAANVLVDGGKLAGRARSVLQVPLNKKMVETHQLRVTAEGHQDHVADVRLRAGQVTTVDVTLTKQP